MLEEVFSYRSWDRDKHDYVIAEHKRTVIGIISCHGDIIPGTEESVPVECIDQEGHYHAPGEPV